MSRFNFNNFGKTKNQDASWLRASLGQVTKDVVKYPEDMEDKEQRDKEVVRSMSAMAFYLANGSVNNPEQAALKFVSGEPVEVEQRHVYDTQLVEYALLDRNTGVLLHSYVSGYEQQASTGNFAWTIVYYDTAKGGYKDTALIGELPNYYVGIVEKTIEWYKKLAELHRHFEDKTGPFAVQAASATQPSLSDGQASSTPQTQTQTPKVPQAQILDGRAVYVVPDDVKTVTIPGCKIPGEHQDWFFPKDKISADRIKEFFEKKKSSIDPNTGKPERFFRDADARKSFLNSLEATLDVFRKNREEAAVAVKKEAERVASELLDSVKSAEEILKHAREVHEEMLRTESAETAKWRKALKMLGLKIDQWTDEQVADEYQRIHEFTHNHQSQSDSASQTSSAPASTQPANSSTPAPQPAANSGAAPAPGSGGQSPQATPAPTPTPTPGPAPGQPASNGSATLLPAPDGMMDGIDLVRILLKRDSDPDHVPMEIKMAARDNEFLSIDWANAVLAVHGIPVRL